MEIQELRDEIDRTGAALLEMASQHVPDWEPLKPARRGEFVGPRRAQRRAELAARTRALSPDRPVNATVTAVRSQTDQNELDKACRAHKGPGGIKPTSPHKRLATFGMRIEIDDTRPNGYRLIGGTARQRACYLRSVERWLNA